MDGLSSPRHEQIIVDVYFPLQSDIMPSFLTQHSRDEKVLGTRDVVYQASNRVDFSITSVHFFEKGKSQSKQILLWSCLLTYGRPV